MFKFNNVYKIKNVEEQNNKLINDVLNKNIIHNEMRHTSQ